jgi:hypothetical protein
MNQHGALNTSLFDEEEFEDTKEINRIIISKK